MNKEYEYDFFTKPKELKANAIQSLQHGWAVLVGISAFSILLVLLPLVTLFFVNNLYVTIGVSVFSGIMFFEMLFANTYVHLKVAKDENVKFRDVMIFLKPKVFFKVFFYSLRNLIIIGFACVLIVPLIIFVKLPLYFSIPLYIIACIPGLLVMLRYLMFNFILSENINYTISEILEINKRKIDEKLGDYIKLQLSYIPYFFLSLLTAGIGFMWSFEYFGTINGKFYLDL